MNEKQITMLNTGVVIGRTTCNAVPFVFVEMTDEFIKHVHDHFDRECEILNNELVIYPSISSGRLSKITHTKNDILKQNIVLFKFNDSQNNNVDTAPFDWFRSVYEVR